LWLAPVQVVVATITNEADDYARRVLSALRQAGLRAEADLRNEKIGYKVREHSLAKVPVLLVVGGRESRENTVAVRRLGSQAQESIALEDAIAKLRMEGVAPAACSPEGS
jgi:threonyl-tRNA synthetase